MWRSHSKWKKRLTFSVNIGSFDDRTKNTFQGKSKYSNFVGCVIQLFIIETFQTVLTFLSSIPCPITKSSTICETKHRSIHLSKISIMKYTYIMVNVGAAEKYYKAICINPDEFKNVILYLGYFRISGKFLSNSRFEEILYQTKMCSVVGIRPVLSRKSLQDILKNSQR